MDVYFVFFFSSRRRHTRLQGDWSSDVCSSDLPFLLGVERRLTPGIERINALFGLAGSTCVLGVHVDAVRAPIDLGSTDLDQLQYPWVDASAADILFQPKHGFI